MAVMDLRVNQEQSAADELALRMAALQLTVQWMQGKDGHLVDAAKQVLEFLQTGE